MGASLEGIGPLEQVASPHDHCAYCDAPLTADRIRDSGPTATPRYCCYGCRLLGEAGQKPVPLNHAQATPWFKIAVGALIAGQSMLLGLAVNLTPPTGPTRWALHLALIISSLASIGVLGRPLGESALENMRQRSVSIELLFLAGIAGALGISLHSTFSGAGAIYYEVVAVLLTVYSIGKTLGAHSRARALAETRQLQRQFETCQKIAPDGSFESVRVSEIRSGDQVRVLPGEPIPIDGRILQGQAFVCETPLTGEPFSVVRRPGDTVYAGSYSDDGELRIAATAPGTERRLDQLLSALETARERPCRMQEQANALVRWFLPLVFAASIATFVYWGWHTDWATGCFNALSVLLIACPCAMGLAMPIALWSGLAALAARGLVVRSGDSIALLSRLDHMVFDKTGTLSQESFSLIDMATIGSSAERNRIIAQLRAVQQSCPHPAARAFESLESSLSPQSFQVRRVQTVPGLGVEVRLVSSDSPEQLLRVGQRGLVSDFTAEPVLLNQLQNSRSDHLIYIEADGRLVAIAAVRERLRDSAADTIQQLETLGIECTVMTGDRPENATRIIEKTKVQGGLTPQDKADQVAKMSASGNQIGFAGDGVNDAPAMQKASWSVALAHGAGVTTASADAVLYGGDLRVLPWAVILSRQIRASTQSNLLFAAAYNVIGIALAACGLLHPVIAALLMVISSFTVSWRALRSTESVPDCCSPIRNAKENDSPNSPFVSSRRSGRLRFQTLSGVLLIAQAPFLIYLGQLNATASAWTIVILLALGLFTISFKSDNPEHARLAQMTFAMLGIGNWGMILGWWADGAFSPATVCAHCIANGFSLRHLVEMPWMNIGMILFGLPSMLTKPAGTTAVLNRFFLGILASIGMLLGMNYGNFVFLSRLSPAVAQPFPLSYFGMTVGMILGMHLFCELGRALCLAFPKLHPGQRK